MSLVPSLLQAIVNIDGEALVMHAGDKPYVVSPSGQVELASRGLTLEAVNEIVNQLLPPEFQQALDEFGAVQYALPQRDQFPREQFTAVVARGGDDVWAEIRRRREADDDRIPEELFETTGSQSVPMAAGALISAEGSHEDDDFVELEDQPESARQLTDDALALPDEGQLWPGGNHLHARVDHDDDDTIELTLDVPEPPGEERFAGIIKPPVREASPPAVVAPPVTPPPTVVAPPAAIVTPPPTVVAPSAAIVTPPPIVVAPPAAKVTPPPAVVAPPAAKVTPPPAVVAPPTAKVTPPPAVVEPPATKVTPPPAVVAPPAAKVTPPPPVVASPAAKVASPPISVAPPAAASVTPPPPSRPQAPLASPKPAPPAWEAPPPFPRPAPPPGVVLPMSRSPIRAEMPPPPADDTLSGLERLLRTAAARGASTLYLSSDARPSVRVDGQLQILDSEPVHTSSDVISLLLTLMPDRSHEALRTGATTEWICDTEDIGRVRCMSFSDHRGPGGVFRMMPVRAVSVDQLGLPREIQSLAIEPEGLVLVVGPRSSGKRTLMSALVDLINRTRRDHVITIEREVNIVHGPGSSFVSQREVRGNDDDVLAAARAALREDPDVLLLEQIRTGTLMNVALEAAASGHLVIAGFSAHNATESIDRIIDLYAPEYSRQVQLALADNLRGVIAQVLLPKAGGGRVTAREVLLNTPAVAGVIAEGKTSQLPMAIEGGRRHGMVPLSDALVAYVLSGTVDVREAYRYVTDRPTFVALLKRQGIDTSAVERLA